MLKKLLLPILGSLAGNLLFDQDELYLDNF